MGAGELCREGEEGRGAKPLACAVWERHGPFLPATSNTMQHLSMQPVSALTSHPCCNPLLLSVSTLPGKSLESQLSET